MATENTNQVPFIKKMFDLRSEIDGIIKNKSNDHYNSSYFDINDTLRMLNPLLKKHELLLTQPIKGSKVYTIIKDIAPNQDGEFECEESYLDLPQNTNPQKMGSAITYYRRYTLASLLGLEAIDDDGNGAIPISKQKPANKPVTPRNQQANQAPKVTPRTNNLPWLDLWDPKKGPEGDFTDAYYQLVITINDHPDQVTMQSVLSKWRVNSRDRKILEKLFNPKNS